MVSELPMTTSTINVEDEKAIRTYPNPFENNLTIDYPELNINQKTIIKILDITGRVIQHDLMQSYHYQVNTTDFPAGLLFFQLISESGEIIGEGKIVKGS